jgi:hypothetical protein
MNDPFEQPMRRIARAKEKIPEMLADWQTFLSSNPYAYSVDPDPVTGNRLYKVKLVKPLPPVLADLAAEAIEALRSALDKASYAAAECSGKINPKSCYFPIAGSSVELEGVIERRCKDVPLNIVALFRMIEPHKNGNNLIWALNRACNTSKHALLRPIGMAVGEVQMSNLRVEGDFALPNFSWDSKKNELLLAIAGPDTNFTFENCSVRFYLGFGDVEFIANEDAPSVLEELTNEVERIVLAIKAEAQRVGMIT